MKKQVVPEQQHRNFLIFLDRGASISTHARLRRGSGGQPAGSAFVPLNERRGRFGRKPVVASAHRRSALAMQLKSTSRAEKPTACRPSRDYLLNGDSARDFFFASQAHAHRVSCSRSIVHVSLQHSSRGPYFAIKFENLSIRNPSSSATILSRCPDQSLSRGDARIRRLGAQ